MATLIAHQLNDRYTIKALLGQQTGRRTFLAEDAVLGCPVVIKLVLFGPDFVWEDLKLFQREAETLKSLDHPAIPKYLDAFEASTPLGKGFALVQTYIQAKSLEACVKGGRQFGEADLQPMARALLSILYYLHSHYPAVIHRDIKPSNILLSEAQDDTPAKLYLVDFGSVQTAKKDGTMTVVGTYGYMPPEQFSGRAQPASDLYSLGATLIYLATGKHPSQLTQDNLTIEFAPYVRFSPSFNQWLTRLTETSLSQRTASAHQALSQLNHPRVFQWQRDQSLTPAMPSQDAFAVPAPASPPGKNYSVSRGDFAAIVTAQELEIQCLRSRIREPLRARESPYTLLELGDGGFKWLAYTVLVFLLDIIVIHLIEASSSVVPDIFKTLAILIPFCALGAGALPMEWRPSPNYDKNNKVSVKLLRQDNTLLFSLTSLHRDAFSQLIPEKDVCHFSQVPLSQLKSNKAGPAYQCDICFVPFPGYSLGAITRRKKTGSKHSRKTVSYQHPGKRLKIVGSRAEIHWLTTVIAQWRNAG